MPLEQVDCKTMQSRVSGNSCAIVYSWYSWATVVMYGLPVTFVSLVALSCQTSLLLGVDVLAASCCSRACWLASTRNFKGQQSASPGSLACLLIAEPASLSVSRPINCWSTVLMLPHTH